MEQKRMTPAKAIALVIFALVIVIMMAHDYELFLPEFDNWIRGYNDLEEMLPIFGNMFRSGVKIFGCLLILVSACLPKPRILAMAGCLVVALGFALNAMNRLVDPMLFQYEFQTFLAITVAPFFMNLLWALAFVFTAVVMWLPKKAVKFLCVIPVVLLLLGIGCHWLGEFIYVVEYYAEDFSVIWLLLLTNYFAIGNTLLLAVMEMIGLAALCNAAAVPGKKKPVQLPAEEVVEVATAAEV